MLPSCEQQVNNLRKSFQSFEGFAIKYNPDTQVDIAADERKAIMGNYSTLDVLDMAFGDNSASSWLVPAINDINTFTGSKNMDDNQVKNLAVLIAQEYKNIKFSILELFFYKFKCGYFGKFYGKVDPMVITCALKDFVSECEAKKQEFLEKEYAKKKQEEDAALEVSHQFEKRWYRCQEALVKYCKDNNLDDVFSSLKFQFYDNEEKIIRFKVDNSTYELIEGKYLRLFWSALNKYFPGIKIEYKIFTPYNQKSENRNNSIKDIEHVKKKQEITAGLESAQKIISNTLEFEKTVLDDMKFLFKRRYGLFLEDFINKYQSSNNQ